MIRIGILTCANTTQELSCCSYHCLHEVNTLEGSFSRYKEKGGAQLAGIISCAGCPTLVAPEVILRKVRSLVDTGLDAIHIADCVMTLCPFRKAYVAVIEEHFPAIVVVTGTHGEPDEDAGEMFRDVVKEMLCQKRRSLADLVQPLHDEIEKTSSSSSPKEKAPDLSLSPQSEDSRADTNDT